MNRGVMPLGVSGFQSTHPVRGATHQSGRNSLPVMISIHAPREGCDTQKPLQILRYDLFQSTHPVRGATAQTSLAIDAH